MQHWTTWPNTLFNFLTQIEKSIQKLWHEQQFLSLMPHIWQKQISWSLLFSITYKSTDISQHVQHCNGGTAGAQIKRERWGRQRETRCNLLLTDSCSGGSNVCHARPQCVNSQVGDDLPGTATAAAPAEATSVGAPWVDLAWLALLGRCSSPRCWILLHRHLPLSHLHPLWSHGLQTEDSYWV